MIRTGDMVYLPVRNELKRKSMGTAASWTPERRNRQREIIRRTKPWLNSTGPKTVGGKAISSKNADTGARERAAMFAEVRRRVRAEHFRLAEEGCSRMCQSSSRMS